MPSHARQAVSSVRRGKNEAHWQSLNSYYVKAIPKGRLLDILDKGSLTHLLMRASEGEFQVNVLKEAWQRPDFSERNCLKLKEREYASIREVELLCKGEGWVVARSVIPRSTLKGELKHLASLGNRPLGASLFKDSSLERTSFEISKFENCKSNSKALNRSFPLTDKRESWGRRSVFRLKGKSVLVAEIFLPTCPFLHNVPA